MENQNKKIEDLSWFEKINLIRKLSLFPAITVMVFIRRRLGYRMMKPTWLIVMTIIMMIFPLVFSSFAGPHPSAMPIFALIVLALGLTQRWRRWHDLTHGVMWHSYSPGISFLEIPQLPPFLLRHRRVNRYLDPVLVLLAGYLVGVLLSIALGIWIMLSAFFLHVFEQDMFERQLNNDLDMLDGMFATEVQKELVTIYEQGTKPNQPPPSLEKTGGIPTGLAPDIKAQIAARRARQRNKPPENPPENPPSDNLIPA